jgi:hypothetical protein
VAASEAAYKLKFEKMPKSKRTNVVVKRSGAQRSVLGIMEYISLFLIVEAVGRLGYYAASMAKAARPRRLYAANRRPAARGYVGCH